MQTIRFVLFLLYRYYSNTPSQKNKQIAYLSSVGVFVALLVLNLLTLIKLFGLPNFLPFDPNAPRWKGILQAVFFILLPGYLLINFFIKEEDLKNLNYDYQIVKKGNTALFIYIALSFFFFCLKCLFS